MTKFETDVHDKVIENSKLFLKRAIREIVNEESAYEPMTEENATVISLYVQFSLELGIKATVIKKFGLRSMLKEPQHQRLDDSKLMEKFLNNSVITKDYNSFIQNVEENLVDYSLNLYDIESLKRFQYYRNRLAHFNYNFKLDELTEIRTKITYVIVHLLIKLLSENEDIAPSQFYLRELNHKEFDGLISYPPYLNEMENFARSSGRQLLMCPICSAITLFKDDHECACCLSAFDDSKAFGFIDCKFCKEKESVIYDRLNIHSQTHHDIRGLCLNCKEDTIVFECPRCNCAYDLEGIEEINCTESVCGFE